MLPQIVAKYRDIFQENPIIVKAPARINLIGEHTDYNQGFVMPGSIQRALYFAFGKTEKDKKLKIWSTHFKELLILEAQVTSIAPSWGIYLQALLDVLAEEGVLLTGVHCVFGGDIPLGAGLSSSAALCCGFLFGISHLFELDFSRSKIALLAQRAEQRVGLNCGLMDQYAILYGKAGKVLQLDCQNLTFKYCDLNLENHTLVLINSKIEHNLAVDSAYNARRAACERVVTALVKSGHEEIHSLRDVSFNILANIQNEIDPVDVRRARYVLAENRRVGQMAAAIQKKDWKTCGRLLSESHRGLSQEYQVSVPKIDLLVALAEKQPGCLGARMMGGGFGGCTLNLLHKESQANAITAIQTAYWEKTKIEVEVYEVELSNGMELVEED
ncbi:MAG: galactokinase [Saprospiraceae bacterium]